MKVLGIKQFHQKTFELLDLKGSKFEGVLGKVPRNFIAVVKGASGNGKSEFCIQLARELAERGKLAWFSYEQGHGADFQMATKRNNMEDVVGNFLPIDPMVDRKENVSLLEDLDNFLAKRNSPRFVVIDSLDYTGFTWDEYAYLKETYGKKKTFIFIAHSSRTGSPKKRITEQVYFDGHIGILVQDYIAYPEKNRFGGFDPYVVYEERARMLNPAFFAKHNKIK